MENSSQLTKKTTQIPRWGFWPTWCSHTLTLTSSWLQLSTLLWRRVWLSTSRSLSMNSIWESKGFTTKAASNTWVPVFSTTWTQRSEDSQNWAFAILNLMSPKTDKPSYYHVFQLLKSLLSRSTSTSLLSWAHLFLILFPKTMRTLKTEMIKLK